jgi:hypothetical protein
MGNMVSKTYGEKNDYSFYMIVGKDDTNLKYIGSTKDFDYRMCIHKSDCNNPKSKKYNFKVYKTIRDNGGWDNFNKILMINIESLYDTEALQIEEKIRKAENGNMNGKKCHTTDEETKLQKYLDTKKSYEKRKNTDKYKEMMAKINKKYVEKNRETLLAKNNEWFYCEICGEHHTRYKWRSHYNHPKNKEHVNYPKP